MSIPIAPIRPPAQIDSINLPSTAPAANAPGDFQAILGDAIGRIQQTQSVADATATRFLAGEDVEVHQIAIHGAQAQLQFELFMAIRNKVVQAYQEVMKLQM